LLVILKPPEVLTSENGELIFVFNLTQTSDQAAEVPLSSFLDGGDMFASDTCSILIDPTAEDDGDSTPSLLAQPPPAALASKAEKAAAEVGKTQPPPAGFWTGTTKSSGLDAFSKWEK